MHHFIEHLSWDNKKKMGKPQVVIKDKNTNKYKQNKEHVNRIGTKKIAGMYHFKEQLSKK